MRLALALLLALTLPAAAQETHDAHEAADHLSVGAGVRVVHAWTRATSGREALIFAEIENESAAEFRLEGAEAEIATGAGLVGLAVRNGAITLEPLPAVPIPAGREMHLAPDGLAVRLEGLAHPLAEGEEFLIHLHFSTGEVPVHVAVESADATRHSHAGHAH